MTGQTLLDYMELLNQELQLQPGEANVTRGLLALNVAQDYFEAQAALRAQVFGSAVGTVTTAANTETTAYPAGLLRIDRLQLLDSGTSRPKAELVPIQRAGGQAAATYWPLNLISNSTGEPSRYWTNGTNIYWSPLPSGTSTVRYYGFASAATITASGTFAYPDMVAFPMAAFAASVLKVGVDDDPSSLGSLSTATFDPVLDALTQFNRDGAQAIEYTQVHST
jgi:hypothetical protein